MVNRKILMRVAGLATIDDHVLNPQKAKIADRPYRKSSSTHLPGPAPVAARPLVHRATKASWARMRKRNPKDGTTGPKTPCRGAGDSPETRGPPNLGQYACRNFRERAYRNQR